MEERGFENLTRQCLRRTFRRGLLNERQITPLKGPLDELGPV